MKLQAFALSALISTAVARCPNGCSSNGECGTNSQCTCHRNFKGADCSERICYFSFAYIDTPSGDINGDGMIDMRINKDETTGSYATESYSAVYGIARPIDTGTSLEESYNENYQSGRWDEAHFYRECSNKGICDRKTGQCNCFPGYEGEGCQRTACPGTETGNPCSGHGLCLSAYVDYTETQYNLWDREKTMKCKCDAGYAGPDCSLRLCPVGPDPVEHADKVTTSLQKISFAALELDVNSDRSTVEDVINGAYYFTLSISDDYHDIWTTKSLSIDYVSEFRDDVIISTPVPSKDFLNAGTSVFDFYSHTNIADDVNASVKALPHEAVKQPYVWMSYTNFKSTEAHMNGWWKESPKWYVGEWTANPDWGDKQSFSYPYSNDPNANTDYQPESGSGMTTYWGSAGTRFPSFINSEFAECGQNMNACDNCTSYDAAAEGLCIFISSGNKVESNYIVTFSYNTEIKLNNTETYWTETRSGTSTSIERTAISTGKASDPTEAEPFIPGFVVLEAGTMVESTMIPLVTVEEVGMHRYWDVNIDGYPEKDYAGFTTDECSRRGLCDYETGECQCFSGYNGVSCDSQNSVSIS